jgi:hypothetical protein
LPRLGDRETLVVFPHDAEYPWGTLKEQDGRLAFNPATYH